jgi:hypothetical protein
MERKEKSHSNRIISQVTSSARESLERNVFRDSTNLGMFVDTFFVVG